MTNATTQQNTGNKKIQVGIVFGLALLIRLIAGAFIRGHESDMNCFQAWAEMVYNNGFAAFYPSESFTDYPPGYVYILYIIGFIRNLTGISTSSGLAYLLTKMPAILADMGIGYLLYRIARKKASETTALILAGIYLFFPAVIMDSTIWGQTDSVFTIFVLLMCLLITDKKLIPAYFVLAVGILIKPQTLIFTPILLYGIVEQVILHDFSWKRFFIHLGSGLCAIVVMIIGMLPYGFSYALAQYTETLGSYEYASVNAYNFWTLIGKNWMPQDTVFLGLTCQTWGSIAIVAAVVLSAIFFFKSKDRLSGYYYSGAILIAVVFVFSVRMHERYLYPVMALLLAAYAMRPRKETGLLFIGWGLGLFANMTHVLCFYDPANFDRTSAPSILTSLWMVIMFFVMAYVSMKLYGKKVSVKEEEPVAFPGMHWLLEKKGEKTVKVERTEKFEKISKKDWLVLAVIVIIYSVMAFYRLGDMDAPETSYSAVLDGTILLDFGEEKHIASMWNFLGYKNNPEYILEYGTEDGVWETYYTAEGENYNGGSVFAWNETQLGITARYVRFIKAENTKEDSLLELVFTEEDGTTIVPVNAEKYETLFDEQELFTGRKTNLNSTYFDEIYHARTAYEMTEGLYCYENTHPPLGKALIAVGVLLFGMNPFGWRFMGVIFGILMLPVIFVFAKRMCKASWATYVTTILFAFDFMHFAQTRIATIDVFVTFFIMLMYYFMYRYTKTSFYDTDLKKTWIPLGLCGVTMGFAWAAKWTGFYASAGLAILFFYQMWKRYREFRLAAEDADGSTNGMEHRVILGRFKPCIIKTIVFCLVFFVAIPVTIYILSYLPFSDGTDRGLVARMLHSIEVMFSYHSTLVSEHPYSSCWYQWPIMYRPIWYYSGIVTDTVHEGISAFGNPLVWWAGIPAFLFMLYLGIKKKDKIAGFLIVAYFSQYLPWVLVTRTTYIYHYFPSVPFITLMLVYTMVKMVQRKPKWLKWMVVYTVLAVVLFALFYPVLSGYPVEVSYVKTFLKWFGSWQLIAS